MPGSLRVSDLIRDPRRTPTPANRLCLDYRREAERLGRPPVPIIDAHCHVNGARATALFGEVCDLFGIAAVYSQSRLSDAEAVRTALGDRVRFIAFPEWGHPDRAAVHRERFVEHIHEWHERFGARMVKLWGAPALRDYVEGDPDDVVAFDSPWRLRAVEAAERLGMMLMVHVADPDVWFRTRYADASRYGTKRQQYESLERLLARFGGPVIAAHMGGWPEDLGFLDGLLGRHANLYLDTSATKWVVRALGRHEPERVRAFLSRWRGRVLFGSDIVTMDSHLTPDKSGAPSIKADQASSTEEAFDLYASRYWSLRTMFETDYQGESPIADPDLALEDPTRHDAMSAPTLRGLALGPGMLRTLFRDAAVALLEPRYAR
ncbi:MAG: amidohydrolase [Phycisphaerales bacterium]|nr:amidohydrolase [Phycisphaerales bacterium]